MGRVEIPDVENMGFGADLFPQSKRAKFSQKNTDFAFGIGNVTEDARIRRTGFDTVGKFVPFDPMVAKGAFFDHTFGANSRKGLISFGIVVRYYLCTHLFGQNVWGFFQLK
jgi:hypothetical protein